jgi:hypothetical protein
VRRAGAAEQHRSADAAHDEQTDHDFAGGVHFLMAPQMIEGSSSAPLSCGIQTNG